MSENLAKEYLKVVDDKKDSGYKSVPKSGYRSGYTSGYKIRIQDDVYLALKNQAEQSGQSITSLANYLLIQVFSLLPILPAGTLHKLQNNTFQLENVGTHLGTHLFLKRKESNKEKKKDINNNLNININTQKEKKEIYKERKERVKIVASENISTTLAEKKSVEDYSPEFESFWKLFQGLQDMIGGPTGSDKQKGWAQFKKIHPSEYQDIARYLERVIRNFRIRERLRHWRSKYDMYAEIVVPPRIEFLSHAYKFLRDREWEKKNKETYTPYWHTDQESQRQTWEQKEGYIEGIDYTWEGE